MFLRSPLRYINLYQLLPFLFVLLGCALFFGLHLYSYFSFSSLKIHRQVLEAWAQHHYALTVCSYMLLYIVTMSFSMPVSGFFAIVAGFMFNAWPGILYSVLSATVGATLFFMLARGAFGHWLKKIASTRLKSFELGFQKNAFKYIVSLRLIPVVPFWIINIAAAVLHVELSVFIAATFVGIVPTAGIYVVIGQHLATILEKQNIPNMSLIFTPEIFMLLLALAILGIVPALYQFQKNANAH